MTGLDVALEGDLHPYYVLDVFTEAPLAGNQLGLFPDADAIQAERMQRIARELNVSETIFLLPPESGGTARVRIFTPGAELPFAGHPVLGAGVFLGRALRRDEVTLETGNGPTPLRVDGSSGWMVQPPFPHAPYERADELLAALGVEQSLLPVEVYENGPRHVFVCLPDEDAVAALRPDQAALAEHERVGAYCFAGSGVRWKSRWFGPTLGVAEDPATGSAAGPLAVHLGRHGAVQWGTEVEIRQGEEIGRPSLLRARAYSEDRAEVGGSAVVVARGQYRIG
ncbi:MAG TPA: PhzF family phenazine biosynthesis protein [Gaiellaceae bacterium]|nr:PhzF family phenazine biosynthesis protein [Gaiellaceae bacterium]